MCYSSVFPELILFSHYIVYLGEMYVKSGVSSILKRKFLEFTLLAYCCYGTFNQIHYMFRNH